jgi:hypothetical protein
MELSNGRFEAHFEDEQDAKAAARDARTAGFTVDVHENGRRWLAVGRRRLAFPGDERERYTSRYRAIATRHSGAFTAFVEDDSSADRPSSNAPGAAIPTAE